MDDNYIPTKKCGRCGLECKGMEGVAEHCEIHYEEIIREREERRVSKLRKRIGCYCEYAVDFSNLDVMYDHLLKVHPKECRAIGFCRDPNEIDYEPNINWRINEQLENYNKKLDKMEAKIDRIVNYFEQQGVIFIEPKNDK